MIKAVLAVAILAAVSRRFYLDLRGHPGLWDRPLKPSWLVLAGGLYLLGLGFSVLFWYRLLRSIGQNPPFLQAVRAYYLGQMGKYVPGKAYALVLRADLARGPGVRAGLAGLTAFYEVLVTMAGGVVVAAWLSLLLFPPATVPLDWPRLRNLICGEATGAGLDRNLAVALALLLLAPLLLTILPPVFNRLAHHLSLPFRDAADLLPRLSFRSLLEGLLLTGAGWLCLGASLGSVLRGMYPDLPAWDWIAWGRITATIGVVYVAGFLVLIAPGGLGVREYFLMVFLAATPGLLPEQAGDRTTEAEWVATVLRVTWTAAELVMVALVWRLPRPSSLPSKEPAP
jgi:uncharacterized membrane protein YbhN (UPF0104 family)